MKNLLAVVAIVMSALVIYTVHQDRKRRADEEVRAAAEANARARAAALRTRVPDRPTAVGISRLLEPKLLDLFAPLDEEFPADLVPPLQIFKERILDKKQHAVAAKHPVYDQAIRTIDLMIAAAEERTTALDNVLRINARPASPLDAANSGTNSKAFFLQAAVKRWETGKSQRKAAIDQSVVQLRTAEREWNKSVGEKAPMERYDTDTLPPVYVKVETGTESANPLERGAYDQRRNYSWRRTYYNQYNSGYPGSYY